MKKIFIFALSLVITTGINAQTISPKVAAQKAASLFQTASGAKGMKATTAAEPELAYTAVLKGDTCFYVFNNPQGGYAIIGGDLTAKEVLATVDNGSFDINNIPSSAQYMLTQYAQDISHAKAKGGVVTVVTPVGTTDIEAICQTTWDQTAPYNNNCVTITSTNAPKATNVDLNKKTLTGCVATAAAQCVYTLYKSSMAPALRADATYKHDIVDEKDNVLGNGTVSQQFLKTKTIDWANMLEAYDESYTSVQGQAVADLMTLMGIISEMQYGRSSGALPTTLWRGLVNYLGIQAKYAERAKYSDSAWEKFIYDELAKNRPICYGGSSDAGGHQFVIDGYQKSTNLFHVNWGWGGSSDGYYALSSASKQSEGPGEKSWLYPTQDDESAGASKEHYRNDNSAIYNFVYDANNLPKVMPAADADEASISDDTDGSQAKASSLASKTTAEDTTPKFYVDDENCKLKVSFGSSGVKNVGAKAEFIWGIELTPVFEGDEPEEYYSYLLSVDKEGTTKETFEENETVYNYSIPLGEYDWGSETDDIPYGSYTITPIMFYDDGTSQDVSDDDIAYVALPKSWKEPVAKFVSGAKPTAINNVNANTSTSSAQAQGKTVKVIRKNRIIINNNSKQYNIAGQQIN